MLKMVRQQMICIIAPRWSDGLMDFSDTGHVYRALQTFFGMSRWFSSLPSHCCRQGRMRRTAAVVDARARHRGRHRSARHAVPARQSSERRDVDRSTARTGPAAVPTAERAQRAIARKADRVAQHRRWRLRRRPRPNRPADQKGEETPGTDANRGACPEGEQYGKDRASFALALARRAYQDPQFEWALEPAPRAYWRGSGASISAKVGFVLVLLCLWLAAVWLAGALLRGLIGIYTWFVDAPPSDVQHVVDASYWGFCTSIRAR